MTKNQRNNVGIFKLNALFQSEWLTIIKKFLRKKNEIQLFESS